MAEKENDFEIMDVEDYQSQKNQEFSHQSLVMIATKKVLEYGCQELIEGYYNTETDNNGKVKVVYRQDTRKAFIESVRTLRMVMICDFDEEAKKKLIASPKNKLKPTENLMDKLQGKKNFWMNQQKLWWEAFSDGQKKVLTQQGMQVVDGYLNMNLPFFEQYFLEELEIYREIFEELTLLTKRKNFYSAEMFEA